MSSERAPEEAAQSTESPESTEDTNNEKVQSTSTPWAASLGGESSVQYLVLLAMNGDSYNGTIE